MVSTMKYQIASLNGPGDYILWKKKIKAFLVRKDVYDSLDTYDHLDKVMDEGKKNVEQKAFVTLLLLK